jgi:hypothetical protein
MPCPMGYPSMVTPWPLVQYRPGFSAIARLIHLILIGGGIEDGGMARRGGHVQDQTLDFACSPWLPRLSFIRTADEGQQVS